MKKTLGNYEIIDKIGAGAMSRVYLACPQRLPDKRVAIKILDPALAMDSEFVARFKREAQAVSLLQHGNVANVFDFGEDGGVHYIVMEYLHGADLRKVMDDVGEIRENPGLPVGMVIYLLEEIAHGLRSAHERGIIHRDIKPTNVLLGVEGEVKVADFGLARSVEESTSLPVTEATMSGAFLGTAAYASPEQAAKEQDLDARTDVFSLGVLAHELLTSHKPFAANDLNTTLRKIISEPHPPLTDSLCVPVFPELVALVDGMLTKGRDQRFPDMDAVLHALQECRQGLEQRGIRYANRRHHLARLATDPEGYCRKLHGEVVAILPAKPAPVADLSPTDPSEATIVPRSPSSPPAEQPADSEVADAGADQATPTVAPPSAAPVPEKPAPPPAKEPAAPPPPPSRPPSPTGRPRRWPWLVGVLGLVAAAVVGAVAFDLVPFGSGGGGALGQIRVTTTVDEAKLRFIVGKNQAAEYPLNYQGVESVTVGRRATVLSLEEGDWFGEVSRDGYTAEGKKWKISSGKTAEIHFDLQELNDSASLYIYVSPSRFSGASIYIDDVLQEERTPATYENLPPGSHVIRAEVEVDGVRYVEERDVELLPGVEDRRSITFSE